MELVRDYRTLTSHRSKPVIKGEQLFTRDDFFRLLQTLAAKIKIGMVCGALFVFLLIAFRPTAYVVEATFKEGVEQTGAEGLMKDLFLNGLKASQSSQTISLMKSIQVLKPVVEQYGLQTKIKKNGDWLAPFRHVRDHLYTEFGYLAPPKGLPSFGKVHYEGERGTTCQIDFLNQTQFHVFFPEKAIIEGIVGQPVTWAEGSFTCLRAPEQIGRYTLQLTPWMKAVKLLKKNLKIQLQKASRSIYEMKLLSYDRYQGASVLNGIMQEHHRYLKQDHDRTAELQISYLEQKQAHLYQEIANEFEVYAKHLKEHGFIDLELEIASYLKPQEKIKSQILSCDLEFEQLKTKEHSLLSTVEKISDLERQKELLPVQEALLASLDLPGISPDELDLTTAKQLTGQFMDRLDQSKARIQLLAAFQKELLAEPLKGAVEISSLSPFLTDPLSQKLIATSLELLVKLKDKNYVSAQEGARAEVELIAQKRILAEHIGQLKAAEEIHLGTLRGKKEGLQQVMSRCIDREISALSHQVDRTVKQRKQDLLEERQFLQAQLDALHREAEVLPDRWKVDGWMKLRLEVAKKIMTALTQLVESKTVSHHLHVVESKPLDEAVAPISAKKPHLCLLTLLGAACGGLSVFGFSFLKGLQAGFPLTPTTLLAMNYPFKGELSPANQLETFRWLTLFVKEPVIGLFGGQGPDYSVDFAAHLRKMGRTVLLLRWDFSEKALASGAPSLLQWLEGDSEGSENPSYSVPIEIEELQLPRFKQRIEESKRKYDTILLWQKGALDSAQTAAFLPYCDQVIATISEECTDQLTPLMDWGYDDNLCRIGFIVAKG